MRAIFVSYRRNDSEGEAGRLFADLVNHFGEASVFMDVAAIEMGRDYRIAIDQSVATCGVLLAIIGRDWIDAKNEAGQRRLDDPNDFVRLETASALKRVIPVVPVLVQGARMPRPDQLPDDLKELAYRNGVELTHARWGSDVQLLIKGLRPYVEDPKKPMEPEPRRVPTRSWWRYRGAIFGFVLSALVAAAVVAYMLWPSPATVPDLTGSTLSAATTKIEALHLTVGNKTYRDDSGKTADIVLSQSPSPNARVKSGTAIDLVLAQQPAMVEIPVLTWKSLDVAEQTLKERHLAVGKISREPSSDVARDIVLHQSPKSGTKVGIGTAIDLTVSEEPQTKQQQLPNFAGTWELIDIGVSPPPSSVGGLDLRDHGVLQDMNRHRRITITQEGAIVRVGDDNMTITSAGSAKEIWFLVPDNRSQGLGRVRTEEQADRVESLTWSVDGSNLTLEEVVKFKADRGHPERARPHDATKYWKWQRVAPE